MKINTSKFGEVDIEENLIFDFIEPILGYEELKKYGIAISEHHTPISFIRIRFQEGLSWRNRPRR